MSNWQVNVNTDTETTWTVTISKPAISVRLPSYECDRCGKPAPPWDGFHLKNPEGGRDYWLCWDCYREVFSLIVVYIEAGKVRK